MFPTSKWNSVGENNIWRKSEPHQIHLKFGFKRLEFRKTRPGKSVVWLSRVNCTLGSFKFIRPARMSMCFDIYGRNSSGVEPNSLAWTLLYSLKIQSISSSKQKTRRKNKERKKKRLGMWRGSTKKHQVNVEIIFDVWITPFCLFWNASMPECCTYLDVKNWFLYLENRRYFSISLIFSFFMLVQ